MARTERKQSFEIAGTADLLALLKLANDAVVSEAPSINHLHSTRLTAEFSYGSEKIAANSFDEFSEAIKRSGERSLTHVAAWYSDNSDEYASRLEVILIIRLAEPPSHVNFNAWVSGEQSHQLRGFADSLFECLLSVAQQVNRSLEAIPSQSASSQSEGHGPRLVRPSRILKKPDTKSAKFARIKPEHLEAIYEELQSLGPVRIKSSHFTGVTSIEDLRALGATPPDFDLSAGGVHVYLEKSHMWASDRKGSLESHRVLVSIGEILALSESRLLRRLSRWLPVVAAACWGLWGGINLGTSDRPESSPAEAWQQTTGTITFVLYWVILAGILFLMVWDRPRVSIGGSDANASFFHRNRDFLNTLLGFSLPFMLAALYALWKWVA